MIADNDSAELLSSIEALVTNSNNYPILRQVAKATNRQKNGSAGESSAGPRRGKCKIIWKKKQEESKNDFQNNKFDKISNEEK